MSGPPAPMNQFMTDEYVLAYHGPLLYEARVSHPISIIPTSFCSLRGLNAVGITYGNVC
jgi:hypothetical protein